MTDGTDIFFYIFVREIFFCSLLESRATFAKVSSASVFKIVVILSRNVDTNLTKMCLVSAKLVNMVIFVIKFNENSGA